MLADRLDQVADVQGPVPVVAVELVPVAREVDLALPLPEQRGLPVARICGEHHRTALGIRTQPVDEAGPPQRRGHEAR